jgi:hypothetical protein
MSVEQAEAPATISEKDQILTQDPKSERQIPQLRRYGDRMPESAQILAAGRAWSDLRELPILHRDLGLIVPAVRRSW